ncbi:aldehyde ferredoxin oxidoreductase C-terminal domain-containing protein [Pseudodesulfovibrio tunisiensis]|nr:aldehyde ferredoxin oxidoreductase C-terminal domain-containing protein [Pseudodesulfovibrio tunisiensis]
MRPIDRDAFLRARKTYYAVRGLDEQGVPVRETAERLGLEWNE